MPFCTACGSRNPDDARFCSQCGTRLVTADADAAAQPGAVPAAPVAPGAPGSPGAPPAAPAAPAGPAGTAGGAGSGSLEPGHESAATMTFRAPVKAEQAEERPLNEADAAAVDALAAGRALLIVQRGPGAGNRFLLDTDTVTAGRHPDSDIFLDDVTVSRRHAEFRRDADGFSVRDVGSLNGTYVNRDRIDDVALQGGDEVQIGKFRLVFFAGQADPAR